MEYNENIFTWLDVVQARWEFVVNVHSYGLKFDTIGLFYFTKTKTTLLWFFYTPCFSVLVYSNLFFVLAVNVAFV